MDQPTNIASYRVACTRLKMPSNHLQHRTYRPFFSILILTKALLTKLIARIQQRKLSFYRIRASYSQGMTIVSSFSCPLFSEIRLKPLPFLKYISDPRDLYTKLFVFQNCFHCWDHNFLQVKPNSSCDIGVHFKSTTFPLYPVSNIISASLIHPIMIWLCH